MEIKQAQFGAAAQAGRDSPARVAKAARDFEAVFIGQMFKSMRESSFGGGWGTQDQSGDVAIEMAEQPMSQMLAANGGLGLAKLIRQGLEQKAATVPDASKS